MSTGRDVLNDVYLRIGAMFEAEYHADFEAVWDSTFSLNDELRLMNQKYTVGMQALGFAKHYGFKVEGYPLNLLPKRVMKFFRKNPGLVDVFFL